jgi:iron-sulfur cluster insertion protein
MLVITEKAGAKIKNLLAEENKADYGLRVYVAGGGCQGFQYGMTFEERANPDDTVVEAHGVKVFVDAQSAPMLQGAEVDYVDSLQGSGFAIKNPQAKASCGCGNSFNA